jgi:hypothetical protein
MRNALATVCLILFLAPALQASAQDMSAKVIAQQDAAAFAEEATDPVADAARQRKAAEVSAILQDHLASSTTPRDQLIRWEFQRWRVDTMPGAKHVATKSSGPSLREIAARAPGDRLVQWMWAKSSASDSGCAGPPACPGRDSALARLEPDNGIAWLPVLERAWDEGDEAGVDAALSRMAAGSRFDDRFVEYAAAWAEVEDRFPDYVGARDAALSKSEQGYPSDLTSIVSGVAVSAASAIPSLGTLANVCNRGKHPEASAARFERCAAVGRLMLGKGSSAMSRSVGFMLIGRSTELTAQDLSDYRAFRWTMRQAIGTQMNGKPDEMRRYFADLFQTGDELLAMQRQVARNGQPARPPAGWKAEGEEY